MGIVSDEDIENINLNVEIQELRQKFQNKIIFVLFRALLQRGLIKGMIWDICEMWGVFFDLKNGEVLGYWDGTPIVLFAN
jgi:hypothetical protein